MPTYWRRRLSSAPAAFSMCRDNYQESTWDAFRIKMLYRQRHRPPSGRSPQQRDTLRRDAARSRRFALPQTDAPYAGVGEVRPGSVHPLRCSTQVRCAGPPPPPIKSHKDRSKAVNTSAGQYNRPSPGQSPLRRDPSLESKPDGNYESKSTRPTITDLQG